MGLLDYPKIVKKPMDLSTVEKNFKQKKYQQIADFAGDMRLIWSNCMLYNVEGSEYYVLAEKLSRSFEKKLKTVPAAAGLGAAIKQPTFTEPCGFAWGCNK